jgi:hypothetical protein
MVRLQIQLDSAQHRQVRRRAKRLGVSVAEVIRRCVDGQLRAEDDDNANDRRRNALAALGRHAEPGGRTNTAADHDAALAEAYRR